jgi:1-acyl-sn-glycerol-3-phosphate acyltransferase
MRRALKIVLWAYLRVFHDIRIRYHPGLPRGTAYIAVISHTSFLDTPVLMVGDAFDPPTTMIVKTEVTRIVGLNWLMRLWGAIPVDRRGRDVAALRRIKQVLAAGQGICIAPAGTRSRDGRLGPINPVLVRLILHSDVPVFPTAIIGTYECMPKGAKLPRPGPIYVDTGPVIDLAGFRGRRLSPDELTEAATRIRDAIAEILPDHMKPLPGSPVLGAVTLEA